MASGRNQPTPEATTDLRATANETTRTKPGPTMIEVSPMNHLDPGHPIVRLLASRMVRRDPDSSMRPVTSVSRPTASTAAALVAFAVIVAVAPAAGPSDDPSFRAGYAAVSNPTNVRSALSDPAMSASSFCDQLLKHELAHSKSVVPHNGEFLRGCGIAVGDAME
jgi:hypothetical protein